MPYYAIRALAAPILINNNAGYMAVIAGSPVMVVAGTLSIVCAVGKRSQASFTIYTASLATHLQQFQQVQIYDASSYLVFSGYVMNPNEAKPGWQPALLTTVQLVDQHYLADKRQVAAVYLNQTPAQNVANIVNTILSQEGVTVGMIYDPFPQIFFDVTTIVSTSLLVQQSSSAIPVATFAYPTVADAMDALVKYASSSGIPYYWQIDQLKRLYFVPYTMIAGPALNGSIIDSVKSAPKVTRANSSYRNSQTIVGGTAQTSIQTEQRAGDGTTQSWTMGYVLAVQPTITVNGVVQTVGLKGSTGFQFYWNQGESVITQDTGQLKLGITDVLVVTYTGQFPTVIKTSNAAQISYVQALDGSSGINENLETDSTLTSLAGGYAEASALLTRYGVQGTQLQCVVKQPGFVQGQLCQTNLPMFGINNAGMLLESITITDSVDGYNLWYQLSLVIGPYDTTWSDFFGSLIGTSQPLANLNVGQSQSLALLANFTGTITLSASYTATVFACPLFSTGTFFNTTTIVC